MSPVERCSSPLDSQSNLACVPLPAPGGPIKSNISAVSNVVTEFVVTDANLTYAFHDHEYDLWLQNHHSDASEVAIRFV